MQAQVTVTEAATHLLMTMDDGKANALTFDMFAQLNAGLDRAQNAGKTVIIAGRPGKFCAGFDLKVMGAGGEPMMRLLRSGAELSNRLMFFETPVIVAVTGHALAMGALLCLSADYRVGIRGDFKIGLNEVAIGMTLPWFGVELARARLAKTHFDRAVSLAAVGGPDLAVEAGFLDETVEAPELDARVRSLAEAFSKLDMPAHYETKQRVRADYRQVSERALERDFS